MYLFIFLTLYMFRAQRAHHQDRQIVLTTTSGSCRSVSVTVSCAGRKFTSDLHTTQSPTQNDSYQQWWLTQFVYPDDEHVVLETCRELKI